MDDHFIDDDLSALRAADPAAGVDASEALRHRVAGIPAEEAGSGPVPLRRRRRWLVPVAAAGVMVAAISGGYVWSTGGFGQGPVAVPVAVATGTPGDPAAPIGIGPSGGGGVARTQAASPNTMPDIGLEWGSPHARRFHVPTFDTAPAQASVYAVDGQAQYSAEDAVRIAAALGITGDARVPENGFGGWKVGTDAGPSLLLNAWGGATASFHSGIPHPVEVCQAAADATYGRDQLDEDGKWAFGQAMIQCMANTPVPTDEFVHKAVRLFLTAIGIDETDTQTTIMPDETDDADQTVRYAIVSRVVDNNVTEIQASVTVSAQGIMNASGPTGEVVSLGEYPIVSPAEAAERLNDPAFAPRLVSWPRSEHEPTNGPPVTVPPDLPAAGSTVPWPVMEHEIVSARLGLAHLNGANGQTYLAPAYEFTAADETVWSVVALAEDALDTTAVPGVGWPRW